MSIRILDGGRYIILGGSCASGECGCIIKGGGGGSSVAAGPVVTVVVLTVVLGPLLQTYHIFCQLKSNIQACQ